MAKAKITLYYDVVSPFGYMAYYLLRHNAAFKSCEVTYMPIFLGGIMKTVGNRPPLEIKNKDKWIELERKRWAQLFKIPIANSTPDGFPVLTLAIQRALTALTTVAPDKLLAVTDEFYNQFWVKRNEGKVDKPEGVARVIEQVAGKDVAKQVMDKYTSDEVKKLLNERSGEAVAEGAFGVPWMVATNAQGQKEAFWGVDHLGQVTDFLGLEKPKSGGWQAML